MSGCFWACLGPGAARWPASAEAVELGWLQAREQGEIVGHGRGPDVGLEVIQALPGAAAEPVGPLEAGDVGLDPGPEVAQLAIHPTALHHVLDVQPALLVQGGILDTLGLGVGQIGGAGVAASAALWRGALP